MMKFNKTTVLSILLISLSFYTQAQKELLQSGPMVGYSTMKEVLLWAQTTKNAKVHFVYWDTLAPKVKYKTETFITQKADAFVAQIIADKLKPGLTYHYSLFINNKKVERSYTLQFETQKVWLWRTDAPDFSFGAGSCVFVGEDPYDRPGASYGGDYQIFNDIYKKQPNFFLWMGDNVYLREIDFYSKTGIYHRYTHTRSLSEMQPMLGSMHHYGTWDDHDFGPNDSDRSYPMKQVTEKAFKTFFPAPNYVFDEGITSFFKWADCDFFMLDNRYWRTPNKRKDLNVKQVLGDQQIEWLLDALVNSYAPFKFVVMGGQFGSPQTKNERMANVAPQERQKIIDGIQRLKIKGVIFLTGDVHHTELTKLDVEGGYPIYDLTVSPMTSKAYGKSGEDNPIQVEGTLIKERNYAHIKVHGTKLERTLTIIIYDANGFERWTKDIKAVELKFPRK